MTSIVIIGGGQAASSAAAKLRELDADVSITILADELVLPYQRPPLSKKYLSREMPMERLILRPEQWFDEQRVDIRLNARVEKIDRGSKKVVLIDGGEIAYDKLLIATGSTPRCLPASIGGDLYGVHVLRSAAHADVLSPILDNKGSVVIVGGGYIGLEVAAVANEAGLDVTLIEMADRILQRVAAPATSDFFRDLHVEKGVKILESTGLDKIEPSEKGGLNVVLSNGTRIHANNVLCGIGVVPTDELAASAGLEIENGVKVDGYCRTSDSDIYSAGDCASFEFQGNRIRLESVPNAINQAESAAANMLGIETNYIATPWFWSDQYAVKLQIAGLNMGYDSTVTRPGKREGSQSIWYYKAGQLIAVDAMNDVPAFMMARRIIENGKNIAPDLAADPAVNLKDYA